MPQGEDIAPKLGWIDDPVVIGKHTTNSILPEWVSVSESLGGTRKITGYDINVPMADAFARADIIYSRTDGSKIYQWLPDFLNKPVVPGAHLPPSPTKVPDGSGLGVIYSRQFTDAPIMEGIPPYQYRSLSTGELVTRARKH